MKKLALLILALVLCVNCLYAAAEDGAVVTDMPVAGLKMVWPKALTETKGTVVVDGAYDLGGGIYYAYWYYSAASAEDFQRLMKENPYELKSDYIFFTFSVAQNQPLSDVVTALNTQGFEIAEKDMVQLGELDSWKFYLYMYNSESFAASIDPEYAAEYNTLCGMKDEIASSFTCSIPFNEYGNLTNQIIRFEGTDLDGNPVSSETLFARNKVSMVNIWATWCGPCVGELADLQAIHARNQDKGCSVVGLLVDTDIEEARRLVSENGITYPIVVVPTDFSMRFPFSAYPTTFYVDSNGTFLETKFTGAYPDMYEDVLTMYLNQQ